MIAVSNVINGFDVYDIETEDHLFRLEQANPYWDPIPVLFIHGGRALIGGSSTGRMNVWDAETHAKLHTLRISGSSCKPV